MSSSTRKLIKNLQKIITNLNIVDKKKNKKIDKVVKKSELDSFTIEELTTWLYKNKVNFRKLTKTTNKKYIDVVWNVLSDKSFILDSDSSSDSDSDSDSDSESSSDSESD